MSEKETGEKRGQILIVDDEAEVLASLRRQLRRDFDVFTAEDAEQAFAILGNHTIQVIVSDQRMPKVSGTELLARVSREHPHATRLLLTAYADLQAVIEAINFGHVYQYITKPWDPDEIRQTIAEALDRNRLVEENEHLLAKLTRANAELEARVAERTAALAESERLYRTIVEGTADPIILTDAQGIISAVNIAFTRVTGYSAAEALGQRPTLLSSGRHPSAFFTALHRSLVETDRWSGNIWNRCKDGSIFVQHLTITCVRDTAGALSHYVGVYTEPTADTDAMEQVWINAQHDFITGLPNRVLLQDRLESALLRAQRDTSLVAVLFLDLDGFKPINDAFGHAVGDEVLEAVADRLRARVRLADTVARLGGDEFVILLPGIHSRAQARAIADQLEAAIAAPILTSAGSIQVGASIGYALFPEDATTAAELLNVADVRMYTRKAERSTLTKSG